MFAELRRQYDLPGIVYSGMDASEAIDRCCGARFISYLIKPVPMPTLLAAVADAVGSSRPGDAPGD